MKAYEVAKYLQSPDLINGIFLVFGPNQGLVFESTQRLIGHYKKSSQEPLNEITLDANQIFDDPAILATNANTMPMFGGKVLIRVRNASKKLTPIIKQLLLDNIEAIIILEADNLKPSDSLRLLLEKNKNCRTLPCYADDERTISDIIRRNFANENITIDPDAITLLRDILGNDREILRREMEKLNLYALESKIITLDDIIILCADNSSIAIDKILDFAGTGHVKLLDNEVAKALNNAIDPQRLLISALNHFSFLRQLRVEVDNGKSARAVLEAQKPRPHFSRKTALEQQLRLWNDARLSFASDRIFQAIYESRKSSLLSKTITKRALMAISIAAARY
ncbi:MAG: DNA polymerase III subunit delta [Devosiaceae bacterium]|nr:DNA polymerase III subunit delta [Devosiaceae bacterium]